ncbi:AlwI family type II restriction endonuclease [Candidatus Roizmanbacteria bacterium]|nr:MAG: AlwI family type II restriction endonuclease [Candidatus Roizmanbacteria bacterium]
MPREIIDLVNNVDNELSASIVDRIVDLKNYRDFAMRGRQSLNPLTKFGFVFVDDNILKITELGLKLIASEKDHGDVFLKSFIKWQIPNPASDDFANNGDYGVVPFVATLKLISEVNILEAERGIKPVGISKREFSLFFPTLVKYTDISRFANEIIKLRDSQKNKTKQERKTIRDSYRKNFATNFLGTREQAKIDKLLTNLRDYGDNAIRYFRLTKFIRIRGRGFYVDLESNRHTEIEALFESEFYKPKIFANRNDYLNHMSNDRLPKLPWQAKDKLVEIATEISSEIKTLRQNLGQSTQEVRSLEPMTEDELTKYIYNLREVRIELQEKIIVLNHNPLNQLQSILINLRISLSLKTVL